MLGSVRVAVWLVGISGSLLVSAGCADSAPSIDTPVPGSPASEIARAAAVPLLTPCRAGHSLVLAGGVDACAPFAGADTPSCEDGRAPFVDGNGCAPVGPACPIGDFSQALPRSRPVLYVRTGDQGDGSRENPFGRIADAIAHAVPGDVIALARGEYSEEIAMPDGVSLQGACAAETILMPGASSDDAAITVRDARNVEVRDLTIGPSSRMGILVESGALTLEHVVVQGTTALGVLIGRGARFHATDLVVRDIEPDGDGTLGIGLGALLGANVEARRLVVAGARLAGVFAADANTHMRLESALIEGTIVEAASERGGVGIDAHDGAEVTLIGGLLRHNRQSAIAGSGEGTHVIALDSSIEATYAAAGDADVGAVYAGEGATATLTRVRLAGNLGRGLRADGATLELEDVLVLATEPAADQQLGRALEATAANVRASRVLLAGASDVGMLLADATDATLADVVVRDVSPRVDGRFGNGIVVEAGSVANGERIAVVNARRVGIGAYGEGSFTALTDVHIEEIGADVCVDGVACERAGHGVGAYMGAAIELGRAFIEGSAGCGAHVGDGASLRISTGALRANRAALCAADASATIERFGDGLLLEDNATEIDYAVRKDPEAPDVGPLRATPPSVPPPDSTSGD